MLVGSHLSIAGGMHLAIESAVRLGLDCVQVFTKNQRQWRVKPLLESEVRSSVPRFATPAGTAIPSAGWSATTATS